MKKTIALMSVLLMILLSIVGCGTVQNTDASVNASVPTAITAISSNTTSERTNVSIKKGDLSEAVSYEDAVTLDVSATTEQGITITEGGTYRLTGEAQEYMITVDSQDKVILVLDNLTLTNSSPAIYVASAKKCVLYLPEGTTSTLTDTTYDISAEDAPNAVIYSKDDLTINGSGTLVINADNHHGIVGKDDVVVTDATLNVTSANVSLKGKDSILILNATLNLTAGTTGIKSTNEEEDGKGYVWLEGSTIQISCKKDAIHAATDLTVASGTISVLSCNEGLEGTSVYVDDGNISIISKDDGINATKSLLEINGGTVYIESNGDGADSNNLFTMNGGTLYVNGPSDSRNSAIDFERSATLNGGTIVALGASGMAENFSFNASTQCVALVGFDTQSAGIFSVKDNDGNILLTLEATRQYNSATITSADLTVGSTYTLEANEATLLTFTPDSSIYTDGVMGFGHGGGKMDGRGGQFNENQDGRFPKGEPGDGQRDHFKGEKPLEK